VDAQDEPCASALVQGGRIEEEVRAEIRAKRPTFEEAIGMLDHRLRMLGLRHGIPADAEAEE